MLYLSWMQDCVLRAKNGLQRLCCEYKKKPPLLREGVFVLLVR
ncbi:hypothetical protein MCHI_002389 [Candidatus Magnetoovum chiemensis]|nr:hypothetical protein MCHI_002389 [Candidatus Magnetoovum chiemensis]